MSEQDQLCHSCCFWFPEEPSRVWKNTKRTGYCTRIFTDVYNDTDNSVITGYRVPAGDEVHKIFFEQRTGPNFGCVHWEEIMSEQDILEEAKETLGYFPADDPEFPVGLVKRFISEVERLRSLEVGFGKLKIQADGLDEQRREQIESLTKERDKWQHQAHWEATVANERIMKLEAENVILQNQINAFAERFRELNGDK